MKIAGIIIGVIAFFGLLAYLTLGSKNQRVEVCVEFNGRTNCRIASAATKEQAQRAATDNACATLTSGMTEVMACGHKPPVSVKWLN